MTVDRRQFLKHIGAGSAAVAMPAFLAGCGVLPATDMRTAAPPNPFLAWFGIDDAMLVRVMSELTARGADHAELFFQHRRSNRLSFADGLARPPQTTIEQGVGLRVVVNGQVGFAATQELTLEAMLTAARAAAAGANGGYVLSPAEFQPQVAGNYYPVEMNWADVALDRRWPLLEQLDQRIRASNPSISSVSVDWYDADERLLIATLDGALISDRLPQTRLSTQVSARRGSETQSSFAAISARDDIAWYTDERINSLADKVVDRVLLRFDARRPPVGEMPVVLAAGAGGIVLHEALGHMLEADFNSGGAGPYAGKAGELVAAPIVSVIDDATMAHERGAINTDDEGVAGQRNVLVEDGVLRGFLHDRRSAAEFGVAPTGSGRRESYRFSPMPRMTCTQIANGSGSREELLAGIDRGIWAKAFADGRVDPANGDFSFEIRSGWLIERGKATAPIRDVRVSGNGPEMLRRVTRLADDGRMDSAGWTCGKRGQRVPVSHGTPSVLVSGLNIST